MKRIVIAPFWRLLLVASLLTSSAHAGVAGTESGGTAESVKAKKKARGGGQVRFLPGSSETTKERSNRLRRECKDQVNAGACSGYTR